MAHDHEAPKRSLLGSPLLLAVLLIGGWFYRDSLAQALRVQPDEVVLHHELNASTLETVDSPTTQDQIAGALEMLFGTPQNPGYLLLEEWESDGLDPNSPQVPEGDYGTGEIDDAEWELIIEGNATRFEEQLALLDSGDEAELASMRFPAWTPALAENWAIDLAAHQAGEYEPYGDDFVSDWRYNLENYYPSLRDSAELYRRQCFHCHGVSGGGDGTTAPYLEPLPRDYRDGIFKFVAVENKAKPRRQDLMHILRNGVYGTAMPSFKRFTRAELNGLVDYVRLLSIRGETEILLSIAYADAYFLPAERVLEEYAFVWGTWNNASDDFLAAPGEVPPATPELIELGRQIFTMELDTGSGEADCASCHGVQGRGDGASAYDGEDPETGERLLAQDDWGNPIQPRNFTRGIFRGGNRPIDIYRRIRAGINGTPMPAHPDFSEEEVWALVHYVRSLSAESNRRNAGRAHMGISPEAAGH